MATDPISPPKKKRRVSLSLSKGKNRFSTASSEELETASIKFVPKNTTTAINWAFRIFSDWTQQSGDENYQPESLWMLRDSEKFATMMSQFCLEVKQQNGKPYTPKSLLQILINLQNYARTKDENSLPFMSQKDERFKRIHTVLDNVSRELHKEGVGTVKVQARVVTDTEETQLWEMGMMGAHSPVALQNAVFFYCGVYFCLRGGDEHRDLKCSQFEIKEVENPSEQTQMIKCLTYTEHGSKNRPGSMHQVHLENKVVSHYSNKELGDRCFVFLMDLYLSKLSKKAVEKDIFYCKPAKSPSLGKPWYYDMPVGHNTLQRKLKDMFIEAGFDSENVSNHSLRATGISRMYSGGVAEKLIMERSGHLSISGVCSYERTTAEQKKDVSDALIKPSLIDYKHKAQEFEAPMVVGDTLSDEKENLDPSDQMSGAMKHFNFQKMDGCTINFNFSGSKE